MPKKTTYNDYLKHNMGDLIDTIELPELQRRFMKSRWLDQVLWLESRATKARNRHYTLRMITIIGGVIVPALVSVNSAAAGNNIRLRDLFGWAAFGVSQAVAISAAAEELFHFGENHRRYRNTAEAMKIEGWQFFQLSGPYKGVTNHADAYGAFATNVENIIQQDVEGYISQAAQADADTKAKVQPTIDQNIALANMHLVEQLQRPRMISTPEVGDRTTTQNYQQYSQQVVYNETDNEFVNSEQIQSVSTVAMEEGEMIGMNTTSVFQHTIAPAADPTPVLEDGESEDEFLSVHDLRDSEFGGIVNPGEIAPTSQFQDAANFSPNYPPIVEHEDSDDEFVTPDQIRGSQFGENGNGAVIAPPPIETQTPAPPPPPPQPPQIPQLATPEVVADILKCPLKDTQKYLPGVLAALQEKGILDKPTLIAAIATIGVETGGFCPIKEFGGPKYFTKMYEGRKDLGNVKPGDGARYHGRGFIQITGRANYRRYGEQLGLGSTLEDNPDLTLDPKISAQILAYYFHDRKVCQAARNSDWRKVRKLVNGGYNGWDEFNKFVQRALQKL